MLGYSIPHVDRLQDILYNLAANAHGFRVAEFAMGLTWIALLLLIKNAGRWFKCTHPSLPLLGDLVCCCDAGVLLLQRSVADTPGSNENSHAATAVHVGL